MLLSQLPEKIMGFPTVAVIAAAAAIIVVWFVLRRLSRLWRRTTQGESGQLDRTIDIGQLPATGPSPTGPRLLLHGMPVRLAVLVLAPVGKNGVLPPAAQLDDVIDQLLPELAQVVRAHQPIFRRWPRQLSAQGFSTLFFGAVRLPDDQGRRTPWSSVAGKFEANNAQFLAGLVVCAEKPNAYGAIAVQHMGEWNRVLQALPG